VKYLINVTVIRATRMLLTEPIVGYFSAYVAFNFAVNFGFFAGIPYVYRKVYGFDTGAAGLIFLSVGIGCIVATILFVLIDRQTYVKQLLTRTGSGAPIPPEERLYGAMLGAILIPIGLFWFAWTTRESIHWIVPTIALAFFGCGNLLVFDCCKYAALRQDITTLAFTALLILPSAPLFVSPYILISIKKTGSIFIADTYGPLNGASANAGNNFLRYIAGAACPLFVIPMMEAMTIKWAISLMGFLSILLAMVPWVFYKWGRRLRERSAFRTSGA
jgi:hypothetical protein